jgi:small GTP-binding protein
MTQPLKSKGKKICLLGASGVGKTSLVRRFVEGKFDEIYRTTIGVQLYQKVVAFDEEQVKLIIWDLEGKDDLRSEYPSTYLGGAQGYVLVSDVTRPETLDVVKRLLLIIMRHRKEESSPPFVLLLNKQDLFQSPAVTDHAIEIFGDGTKLFGSSAKTGERVNEAFEYLVRQMLEVDRLKIS